MGYMVPDRQLDPYYAEFLPVRKTQEIRPHVHPGFEFLYVLEGELEVRHGDAAAGAEPGRRSVLRRKHAAQLPLRGQESSTAIIVTMHQTATSQPAYNLRPLGAPMGLRTGEAGCGSGRLRCRQHGQ